MRQIEQEAAGEDSDSDGGGDDEWNILMPERKKRKKFKISEKILPENWEITTTTRTQGKSKGTTDTYYINPDGKRFRSIREVERFLGVELPVKIKFQMKEVPSSKKNSSTKKDEDGVITLTDSAAAAADTAANTESSSSSSFSSSSSSSAIVIPPPPSSANKTKAPPPMIKEVIEPEFYDHFEGDW